MLPLRILIPIALTAAALQAPAGATAQTGTIAVNGSVTQKVANDSASLGFSVSKERKSRAAALRVVAQRLRAVIAAVQATPGVGPGDVATGSIAVRKVSSGERVLYRAGEGIGVILHQPDKAGELVGAAIRAGATGTSGPNFFLGNPTAAYNTALLAAFDQAKERGAALAARAGAALGPAVSIEEGGGVSAPVQPAAKGVSAPCATAAPTPSPVSRCSGATPPVKPGTSTVTATVHVVFALQ
jgi:uncharacterized protein